MKTTARTRKDCDTVVPQVAADGTAIQGGKMGMTVSAGIASGRTRLDVHQYVACSATPAYVFGVLKTFFPKVRAREGGLDESLRLLWTSGF